MMGNFRKLDVREVLVAKNPKLGKTIPGFIIRYLRKIIHQDELNQILSKYGHLKDREFVAAALNFMGISYQVFGTENLPREGRFIFASNHPLGGLDGLVFMDELTKHYPAVKFPVNDLLLNLTNMSGIFLPVNKHGSQDRDYVKAIDQAYASDDQILYFPAGICSRKIKGEIYDLNWHKSFINKAVWHRRDVIPVYFSGRNSNFFYNLANFRSRIRLKPNIEMLYLADEMFAQRGKELKLVFGKSVPWQTFDKTRSATGWANYMKEKSYDLATEIP